MTEPKFKVGQEVWLVYDGNVEIDTIAGIETITDSEGNITNYYTILSCYVDGGIMEDHIFPTSAALLADIERQIKEIEK